MLQSAQSGGILPHRCGSVALDILGQILHLLNAIIFKEKATKASQIFALLLLLLWFTFMAIKM